MARVIKGIPAVLTALVVAAAMAMAAGIFMTQPVFADDDEEIQLDKISFQGETSEEWWAHQYALESQDQTLTKEEMDIQVLDEEGNEVDPEAYTLTLYTSWYDRETGEDKKVEVDYPVGLSADNPDTEEGYNEMIANVQPVEGVSEGEIQQCFVIYNKYRLGFLTETSFPEVDNRGWRMMDYAIVPKDKMQDPVIESGEDTLELDKDYKVTYYKRVNDETDDRDLIATGGVELEEMPTECGKYYFTAEGIGDYSGSVTMVFDIAETEDPTYISALTSKKKPVTVKAKKAKKAKQVIPVSKFIEYKNGIVLVPKNDPAGFKAYKKTGGAKCLSINANTGEITVKKGTKKGTYKIKVKVYPGSIYEDAAQDQVNVNCFVKVK